MNEFSHYDGCKLRDPDNCSGCALLIGGKNGPNYAGWPLVYLKAGREIPRKWIGALLDELNSENKAYVENLRKHLKERGLQNLF